MAYFYYFKLFLNKFVTKIVKEHAIRSIQTFFIKHFVMWFQFKFIIFPLFSIYRPISTPCFFRLLSSQQYWDYIYSLAFSWYSYTSQNEKCIPGEKICHNDCMAVMKNARFLSADPRADDTALKASLAT